MCMTTQYDYFRRASLIHLVRLFQVGLFWGHPVLFKRFLSVFKLVLKLQSVSPLRPGSLPSRRKKGKGAGGGGAGAIGEKNPLGPVSESPMGANRGLRFAFVLFFLPMYCLE